MIESLFLLGIRQRNVVGIFVVLVTILLGLGIPRLETDTSFNSLIPADEPDRLAYQKVMDEFGSDNKTIMYFRDQELWTPAKLTRLDSLVRKLKQLDHVTRVDSLFNLRTIEGEVGENDEKSIAARPVLDGVPLTEVDAAEAQRRAESNPLYIGNLFSKDGVVTAIIVTVADMEDEQDFQFQLPIRRAGSDTARDACVFAGRLESPAQQ